MRHYTGIGCALLLLLTAIFTQYTTAKNLNQLEWKPKRSPKLNNNNDIQQRQYQNQIQKRLQRQYKPAYRTLESSWQQQQQQQQQTDDNRTVKVTFTFTNSTKKKKKSLNSTKLYCYNQKYKRTKNTGIEWQKELQAAAAKLSRNNSIVLTGGDWTYRATVLNWMAHADNIGVTEYIVICYSKDMLQLVGSWQEGGHGILVEGCIRVIEFMFMKIVGLYHLHTAKYIVTWSDCDAIWLRPFMDEYILPYKSKVDFLAQKALHPVSISRVTGSVICTGLFTVFPSPKGKKSMKLLIHVVSSYRQTSDQLLVNVYLSRLGAFSFEEVIPIDDFDNKQVVAIPTYTNQSSTRIGFLPSGLFPRSRTDFDWARVQKHNPVLWHSFTGKFGQSKVDGMKNASVFALKDGWEKLRDAADVPAFYDKSLLLSQKWRNVDDILLAYEKMKIELALKKRDENSTKVASDVAHRSR
jgi:hypothetical protein